MAENLGLVQPFHYGVTPPANLSRLWCVTSTNNSANWTVLDIRRYNETTGLWESFITAVVSDLLTNYVLLSENNKADGYLKLDSSNKIPAQYLSTDGLIPKGVWDASTGNPPTATPNNGEFWIVQKAGDTNLQGYDEWELGDWAMYLDDVWERVPSTQHNLYNGVDSDSTILGATAAVVKMIWDNLVWTNDRSISNLQAIVALQVTVGNLETNKQNKVTRIYGTVTGSEFQHEALAEVNYDHTSTEPNDRRIKAWIAGELRTMNGLFTKDNGSDTANLHGDFTDHEIYIEIWPEE